MIRALLTALVALTPMAAHAQYQDPHALHGTELIRDPRPMPRGEALLRRAVLSIHNRARADFGVAPIAWDEGLARYAAAYARRMASTNRFEHDPQAGPRLRQGENLWMGTRARYPYEMMIQSMVDERVNFRPGIFPNVSHNGRWWEVGHYTQLVWPTTSRVGCALASNRTQDFLVCRYSPPGNVVGTLLR